MKKRQNGWQEKGVSRRTVLKVGSTILGVGAAGQQIFASHIFGAPAEKTSNPENPASKGEAIELRKLSADKLDIAVIGGGPAGLSAALRARWMKDYRGFPSSVVVFDPAHIGGLSIMGDAATLLTSPNTKNFIRSTIEDIKQLSIPFETATVDRIVLSDARWSLYSHQRKLCQARAVVIATGLRKMSREYKYFRKGFTLTHKGYDFIFTHLKGIVTPDTVKRVIIVGNAKSRNLIPVLQAIDKASVEIIFLLDAKPSAELSTTFGKYKVLFGDIIDILGEPNLKKIVYVDAQGEQKELECNVMLADYTSFGLQPEFNIAIEGLKRNENGFIKIDRDGSTNLPGVFAGGDCTGVYSMALKAYSEGSVAGMSAGRYVFKQKFGYEPPLFAYAPSEGPILPNRIDYPELVPNDLIEILGDASKFKDQLGKSFDVGSMMPFDTLCRTIGDEKARKLVYAMLDEKVCTIQPSEDKKPRSPVNR